MATEVYTTEEIVLQDGTEYDIRPLPIAKMRKFMRIWSQHIEEVSKKISQNVKVQRENNGDDDDKEIPFSEADLTDLQFDVYVKLCTFGLEGLKKEGQTAKQFNEYLEENLDEPTIYKVLNVTGGLKLGDTPNQNPTGTVD